MGNIQKYSLVLFLSLSLFLSLIIQSYIIVDYYFSSTKEYTEKYCENKNTPELNCEGTCHLSKQLQLTGSLEIDSNSKTSEFNFSINSILSFFQLKKIESNIFIKESNIINISYKKYFDSEYIPYIFRPPTV